MVYYIMIKKVQVVDKFAEILNGITPILVNKV